VDPLAWLVASDPAIRSQALRDLTDAPPAVITAERALAGHDGIGADILALQEPDGSWHRAGQPLWSSTLFTFLLLRATGIDPADPGVARAVERLEVGLRWNSQRFWDLRPASLGGNPYFEGEEEPCINGGVLALGGYFGRPANSLAQRLLREQLEDGGWNCDAPKSARSSFHTTICVLEGLLEYERAAGSNSLIAAARERAEQYLLKRFLFRRLSTHEIANPEFLELAFPPRYHYDILRALDYFRAAGLAPDERMRDAVEILRGRQQADGRWPLDRAYDEVLALPLGERPGEPSRWNTLRALRVLRWFEQKPAHINTSQPQHVSGHGFSRAINAEK
jgi:hypothetical protein